MISDSNNEIEIRPASYWEVAVKISIGKYSLPEPYEIFVEREIATNNFHILRIEPRHAAVVSAMPFHHRDPFDRLMIAEAMAEQISIISADTAFDAYGVTRLW